MEQQVLESHPIQSDPQTRAEHAKKTRNVALVILTLLIIGAVISFVIRLGERSALAKETQALAVPSVAVIHPQTEAPQQDLELPSTLQAFTESPIYARTNGYLAKWYKDIGSKVNKGELLADIETPEVDQELLQAKAAYDQANAQLQIAKTSAKRWEDLRKQDAVAQQETDERTNTFVQGGANLAAAAANVRRLEQLESFKHIYAPFSGVITKRLIDIGALINAGNGGMNQELFDLARIDPIRVYVDVPEIYAPFVHRGVHGSIELASLSGQKFTGDVERTADSIDPTTRTLRTEIDVPNPKAQLFPGAFAQVHFAVNVTTQRLSVPVNALIFGSNGTKAALVGSDNKVHLQPVVIGRDYGSTLEVLGGLQANDTIILNPSDSIVEGQQVQVTAPSGGKS